MSEEQTQPNIETTSIIRAKAQLVLLPRLSEKANKMVALNKYIFKVSPSTNKISVRNAVESQFGVKVATVNMICSEGKFRRYGKTSGKMSNYKKAIVTLTKDSKKIETVEAA